MRKAPVEKHRCWNASGRVV